MLQQTIIFALESQNQMDQLQQYIPPTLSVFKKLSTQTGDTPKQYTILADFVLALSQLLVNHRKIGLLVKNVFLCMESPSGKIMGTSQF